MLDLPIEEQFRIETAMTIGDKTSLLAVRGLVRSQLEHYTYLEIGSERGGSILPFLADRACERAYSVDLRPAELDDERGVTFFYTENSTKHMLDELAVHLNADELAKLCTFECDARELTPDVVGANSLDVAFIDGEHTNTACFSDFLSLMPFVKEDAFVVFHDANLISDAIQNIEMFLRFEGITFASTFLPDHVAVIGLGGFAGVLEEVSASAHDRASYLARCRKERFDAIVYMRQNPSPMWRV